VALFPVIDEAGLEAGLDPGDDPLVDVAFAGLATGGFDIDVNELLAIDNRYAQFLCVRSVEQHSLHAKDSRAKEAWPRAATSRDANGRERRGVSEVAGARTAQPEGWSGRTRANHASNRPDRAACGRERSEFVSPEHPTGNGSQKGDPPERFSEDFASTCAPPDENRIAARQCSSCRIRDATIKANARGTDR